jgi:hypothetical protein
VNVIVVDTSVWISFFSGKTFKDVEMALKEGRIHLPPIVLAELLSAKLTKSEKTDLIAFLDELPLCVCDFEHWIRVGELRGHLLRKGISISTPDAHVAQCALDLEGYLATEDKIFSKISDRINLKLL